ncbi:hypothetical protein NGRA_3562, partial [Nosema granulosis]
MRSEKGKEVLTVENFVFLYCNMHDNVIYYWRCKTEGCKVTARTVGRTLIDFKGEHYHSDNQEEIILSELRDIIKGYLIIEPYRPAQEIYDCAKEELVDSYAARTDITHMIPAFDSVKSNIYRWRSALVPSGIVISRETFNYDFFKIGASQDMLLHVDFDEPIVIMGDINYIKNFTAVRNFNISMDGTFKSSSSSFFQIYIIHGTFSGQFFPLMYCFLIEKTERIYE